MENTNFKKILFLCLPIIFALTLAIMLAAGMAQAQKSLGDSMLNRDEPKDTEAADKPVNSIIELSKLDFRSNGDGTCSVMGIGDCLESTVKIPEKSPEGDTVTSIADSAFLGCKKIKAVSFPETLKKIGGYAFYGSSLESVTVLGGIEEIGECAFSKCGKLTAITVDLENEYYSSLDGVLFSKDKSELICYPSGKTNSAYTIRSSVKKIHKMAFSDCEALKTVNYNGTEEDFRRVEIGPSNTSLTSAQIKFPSSQK